LNWVNRESRDLRWRCGCLFTFVGASCGHLCDSTAFLFLLQSLKQDSNAGNSQWLRLIANQTQPLACCSDDQKCPKYPLAPTHFGARRRGYCLH